VVPELALLGGTVDEAAGADMLGADWTPGPPAIAGTRGNENTSFTGGNTGSLAVGDPFSPLKKCGDEPGTAVAPAAETGIAPTSAPLGGAVGGDDGMAGTEGNENVSLAGGAVLSPSGK
jgi:hypothetical protein